MNTSTHFDTTSSDPREITRNTRLALGFNTRDTWRDAKAYFGEHTLTIQGHPVMEDWEESYMSELAAIAASEQGTILEVGYGMGISARKIQQHPIRKHIIIEANHEVYQNLLVFRDGAQKPVIPLFGFWEDVVSTIPSESISGILFDTYPLTEEDIHQNHFPFFKEAHRLLRPDGVLTYYSDEIDDFSPTHRQMLLHAGFTNIQKKVCVVEPPADCKYWKSKTIVAPIIRK